MLGMIPGRPTGNKCTSSIQVLQQHGRSQEALIMKDVTEGLLLAHALLLLKNRLCIQ